MCRAKFFHDVNAGHLFPFAMLLLIYVQSSTPMCRGCRDKRKLKLELALPEKSALVSPRLADG